MSPWILVCLFSAGPLEYRLTVPEAKDVAYVMVVGNLTFGDEEMNRMTQRICTRKFGDTPISSSFKFLTERKRSQ